MRKKGEESEDVLEKFKEFIHRKAREDAKKLMEQERNEMSMYASLGLSLLLNIRDSVSNIEHRLTYIGIILGILTGAIVSAVIKFVLS